MREILVQAGISPLIIIPILMLPIVATLIGIARHIIGLKTVGFYVSIVLSYLFYELSIANDGTLQPLIGLRNGIILFILIYVGSAIAYILLSKAALHYYPKIAFVITMATLTVLIFITVAAKLGVNPLDKFDIFVVILLVTLSEKIIALLTRKNTKVTIMILIESLILGILSFLIMTWPWLQNLLLDNPFLLILPLPINYFIGRFTGLRLSEYVRFKDILEEEE